MKKAEINLGWEKEKIHCVLAEELGFPPYYGKNLDALYDVLTEMSEETVIKVEGESIYGKKLVAAITDAATVNDKIRIETAEEKTMAINEAKEKLYALQAKLTAYNHATAVLYFDGATTAPKGTGPNRAQTLAVLSGEIYRLSTGEETVQLLEYLEAESAQLSEKENRMVSLMLKGIRQMQKIPFDRYVEHQKLIS
ncbi:MAG: barstar family protein, partial [Oscillospiraceae bacterium]|nr:barstar family protein [Oscillospiraceae bacterium]